MLAVKVCPPWPPLWDTHMANCHLLLHPHPLTGEPSAAHNVCRPQACFQVGKLRPRG